MDTSRSTRSDTAICNDFVQAIERVQKGEKDKDTDLTDFYTEVQTVYPEIQVPTA